MARILGIACAIAASVVLAAPAAANDPEPGIGPIEGASFQELLWHDAFDIQFKEKRDFIVLAPGSPDGDFDVYPCRTVNTTDAGGGFSGDLRGELLSVSEIPVEWIEDVADTMVFDIADMGPIGVHVAISMSAFSGELVSDSGYEAFVSGIISRTTLTDLSGSGTVEMVVAYPLARHLSIGEADEVAIDFSLLDPLGAVMNPPTDDCWETYLLEEDDNFRQLQDDLDGCESVWKRIKRVAVGGAAGGAIGGGVGSVFPAVGTTVGAVLGGIGGGIGNGIVGEGDCKSDAKARYRTRYWANWTAYLQCATPGVP